MQECKACDAINHMSGEPDYGCLSMLIFGGCYVAEYKLCFI